MRKRSAQRRARRVKDANPTLKRIKKLVYAGLFFLSLFLLVNFTTNYWDGKTKLPVVVIGAESVSVIVFDPAADSITTVSVPGNTEVEVARQLGTWKLGSVGKLGENEGLGGRLVAETLVYHFSFPVSAWAGEKAVGFAGGDVVALGKASLLPYKSNLGFGDKVKLGIFAMGVKDFKRQTVFLEETGFLQEKELVGGERGYVALGETSGSLVAIFAEPTISSSHASVQIINASGGGTDERVGRVIEVLGAKVASVVKESEEAYDCRVSGVNPVLVEKVAKIFGCEKLRNDTLGAFAAKIYLGGEFSERF